MEQSTSKNGPKTKGKNFSLSSNTAAGLSLSHSSERLCGSSAKDDTLLQADQELNKYLCLSGVVRGQCYIKKCRAQGLGIHRPRVQQHLGLALFGLFSAY